MHAVTPLLWLLTSLWFFGLLFGDLILSRKHEGVISARLSIVRSLVWIGLGVAFGVFVWWYLGSVAGQQYFTGFIIEKSLSVDNIFVWSALLAYLKIPRSAQYTVLFWGIIGAIFFRTLFMIVGVALIEQFQFMLIILGFLLLYTAYGIFADTGEDTFSPRDSKIVRFLRAYVPFSNQMYGNKIFTRIHGKRVATFLFFAICTIELTDILFAIDSVPTVIAVVRDPYVALTSNIAAILGLRALYFVFDNLKESFWLLNKGLSIVLAVVGVSLILEPRTLFGHDWFSFEPPIYASLLFIAAILSLSIIGSVLIKPPRTSKA